MIQDNYLSSLDNYSYQINKKFTNIQFKDKLEKLLESVRHN